jgi:hypothetical protein
MLLATLDAMLHLLEMLETLDILHILEPLECNDVVSDAAIASCER